MPDASAALRALSLAIWWECGPRYWREVDCMVCLQRQAVASRRLETGEELPVCEGCRDDTFDVVTSGPFTSSFWKGMDPWT